MALFFVKFNILNQETKELSGRCASRQSHTIIPPGYGCDRAECVRVCVLCRARHHGVVEFRSCLNKCIVCDRLPSSSTAEKKRNSLTIVQNGQPFLGVNVPHLDVTFGGCRGCRLSMSGRFKIRMDLVVERNWMSRDCASLRATFGLAQLGFLISLSSYQASYRYLLHYCYWYILKGRDTCGIYLLISQSKEDLASSL
jgi:hypothetical protein